MHLYKRYGDAGERVAQGNAGMRVARRIDQDESHPFLARPMNTVDQLTLQVALVGEDLHAAALSRGSQTPVDLGERLLAVDLRFASAEQVQVRPVQDQYLFPVTCRFWVFGHFSPKNPAFYRIRPGKPVAIHLHTAQDALPWGAGNPPTACVVAGLPTLPVLKAPLKACSAPV